MLKFWNLLENAAKYSPSDQAIELHIRRAGAMITIDVMDRGPGVPESERERIFEPLGMKSMVPEFDAAGTLIGGSLIHGTARDWARFGEFLRNRGAEGGEVRAAIALRDVVGEAQDVFVVRIVPFQRYVDPDPIAFG